MERIPAIDILNGRCAQLVGGVLGTEKYYGSPVDAAKKWVMQGAGILHVVDLDATLDRGDNFASVLEIKKATNAIVQFGGGIRSVEKAARLLECGIDRIIIGTMAVEDYKSGTGRLEGIAQSCGNGRIIAAIDSQKGVVVSKGWTVKTGIPTNELIKGLEDRVWGFLYTNVDVEGRMKGVDIKSIRSVVDATDKPVIISGGVSSAADIRAIESAGAWGVVLGKALYEGKIGLKG
ncbi:MAG: HisA/HisF-related TIM barrel protein [Candidatus Altiarchaeota archaeon]|nr:HisA/HisF-related TIM barrel protein [Candidatus Altiarchaeota archaeon]